MVSKFLVFAGATAVLYASLSWSADFRENNWGDSPEAVQAIEGEGSIGHSSPPGGGAEGMYLNTVGYWDITHLGLPSLVAFYFTTEGKLGMVSCVPYKGDVGDVDYFYYWEEALSEMYGEPENRDDVLIDDQALLTRYYRGVAAAVEEGLLKGYFALVRYWETEKTLIWLVAEFYHDRLWVHVNYYSKEYFDFFREDKRVAGPRGGLRPWFVDLNY